MRRFQRLTRLLIGTVSIIVLLFGIYSVWYANRPLPQALAEHAIFEGITYERVVQRDPHPLIYHVVKVDLDAPGISFLVTPRNDLDGYDYAARTTSQFLGEFGPQVAINGDFFKPFYSNSVFDFYPRPGDGVNTRGINAASNQLVSGNNFGDQFSTVYFTANQVAFFEPPSAGYEQMLSGSLPLVAAGEPASVSDNDSYTITRHPRTAIAQDATGRTLIAIVVDGRQTNYSEGASLRELTALILQHGGYQAINLDGGGSSTLVQMDRDGGTKLLNSPIHTRVPGRERPVANHLGIYAKPLS